MPSRVALAVDDRARENGTKVCLARHPPTRFVERRSANRDSVWANAATLTRWLRVSQHDDDLRKHMFPQVSNSLPGAKK